MVVHTWHRLSLSHSPLTIVFKNVHFNCMRCRTVVIEFMDRFSPSQNTYGKFSPSQNTLQKFVLSKEPRNRRWSCWSIVSRWSAIVYIPFLSVYLSIPLFIRWVRSSDNEFPIVCSQIFSASWHASILMSIICSVLFLFSCSLIEGGHCHVFVFVLFLSTVCTILDY